MKVQIGDIIEGYEWYGAIKRKISGEVFGILDENTENKKYYIKADDEYEGNRGTYICYNLGSITILKSKSDSKPTNYPESILKILRQRIDLEEDDTSKDTLFLRYSKDKVLQEVLEWEGFIGYKNQIKEWIEQIYFVDLSFKEEK